MPVLIPEDGRDALAAKRHKKAQEAQETEKKAELGSKKRTRSLKGQRETPSLKDPSFVRFVIFVPLCG